MGGFEIALVLIGIVCGNLGAVLVRPLNLGLFWNSIWGGLGAAAYIYCQAWFALPVPDFWGYGFLAAGGSGMIAMLLVGGLVALRFRD
ncbi:MAG: hypothetical protein GXP05_01710 [Alphaproteobacteria bacterium]|nr:hypothetical protein [Alphaproteobacteria bacterium]